MSRICILLDLPILMVHVLKSVKKTKTRTNQCTMTMDAHGRNSTFKAKKGASQRMQYKYYSKQLSLFLHWITYEILGYTNKDMAGVHQIGGTAERIKKKSQRLHTIFFYIKYKIFSLFSNCMKDSRRGRSVKMRCVNIVSDSRVCPLSAGVAGRQNYITNFQQV